MRWFQLVVSAVRNIKQGNRVERDLSEKIVGMLVRENF